MPDLLETLCQELERPREVTPQVARHLGANYEIALDEIGPFLVETLPTLEDDEVDLILSPLFTPKLDDQTVFAAQLGRLSVPPEEQARLVARAVARPTTARLVAPDGQVHAVPLGEVVVERYVYRLRLQGTIPEHVFGLIERSGPRDQPLLQAIARRAIWESGTRSGILTAYLGARAGLGAGSPDEDRSLLDLVERYKPADIGDLVLKIPQWQEALRGDLSAASGGKPFFSQHIEGSHGGDRDHRDDRSVGDSLVETWRRDLEFLGRLEQLLKS